MNNVYFWYDFEDYMSWGTKSTGLGSGVQENSVNTGWNENDDGMHGKIRSDQMDRSVLSDSLQPHESQHARPPCLTPTPRVHSDSRPSSQ